MTDPERPSLVFDDVVIDFAGRRVLRAGELQPLEPKAFEVLALLAGAPGHAFDRDALLDAVWGHRHVTPGVLNRVMSLLRQALGEDAQHPRYLYTLHGVGYRFDLPAAVAAPVHASGASLDEAVVIGPAAEPVLVEAVPVESGPIAPAANRAADTIEAPRQRRATDAMPTAPGRRRALRGFLAALALLLIGVATWQLWPDHAQPALAVNATSAGPTLAILPLRALGNAPGEPAFADGLSEELIGLLAQIEGLRVISRTSSFQFRDSTLAATAIAQQLKATHLLEGSVRQDGQRLRIALRLIDARSDRTLWSDSYDREFRDIFEIQDSIARAVGDTLRLRLGLQPAAREDPELYRRYLLAWERFNIAPRGWSPHVAAAAADMRALVDEHPDYARAWGGLAVIRHTQAAQPTPQRDALRIEAEQAAARALRLDPEQPAALAVIGGQACREQRWGDCQRQCQRALRRAPSDSLLRTWHAHSLATTGHVSAAREEADRALALDPLSADVRLFRGRILDTLGRHAEARRDLELAGQPLANTALFFNAIWRRDYAEARRIAEALPADTPWRASNLLALEALQDPARLPALHAQIERFEKKQLAGPRVSYDFMRFLLPQRDYARDIAGLDAVQQAGYASYQWLFWMPSERPLRQHPAFQRYLRDSGLLAYWREHGWPDACHDDGHGGAACG